MKFRKERSIMPISTEALAGLRAAVQWNPEGARALWGILIEYAAWVKYKDDTYGPLGLILFAVPPRKRIWKDVSIPIKSQPFPEDKFTACEVFGDEWKKRRFTKKELADTIKKILTELKED